MPQRLRPNRMRLAVRMAAGAVSVVVLAGCGSTVAGALRAPGISSQSTALKTCGRVTPSTGRLRNVLQVHLSGPTRLVTGSVFKGTVTVSLRPGVKTKKVFLSSGAPILPLITRGTDVVGEYEGDIGPIGVSAIVTAGRPFRFPPSWGTSGSVLLRGCPDLPTDPEFPDKSRQLLSPGRYVLYAYIGDESGNDTSKNGILRSQPLTITVTKKTAN